MVEEARFTLGKMQNPVRGFLHGTAAIAAVVGTVVLAVLAPSWSSRVAVVVFGLGLIALYTTSSLYHSIPWQQKWKLRMQRLDHSMIFVLIAASYTPVAAIALDGWLRWTTLTLVWSIATFGVTHLNFFHRDRWTMSIALMVTLGWLSVFIIWPLASKAGVTSVVLLAAGGALYTIGMVFVVTNRPRLWPRVFGYHEAFHVLVVAASVLHFMVTLRYVLPLAA